MHIRPFLFSLAFLLLGAETLFPVQAQIITAEQVFPVRGYSIFEKGYPVKIIPGAGTQFHFIEYWAAGEQGRPSANHYLQTYQTYDFSEAGFVPVTPPGEPLMQVSDLRPMGEGMVVIGVQERTEDGYMHTVANFFDQRRQRLNESTVVIGTQEGRRRRKYKEWTAISPQGSYLLWVGHNKRNFYAGLYDRYGEQQWQTQLEFPDMEQDFLLSDVAVDERGLPYLLLRPKKKEPGVPLSLLRFRHESGEFLEELLTFDQQTVVHGGRIDLRADTMLLISGTVQQMQDSVFLINGEELEEERVWTDFFLANYAIENETELRQKYLTLNPIPPAWVERFQGEEGPQSNFKEMRLMAHNGQLLLLHEEQYQHRDTWHYYDLGVQALNLANGERQWQQLIAKRQRDRGTDAALSYVAGISRNRLRLVFLTERGARGKLMCTSLDLADGERRNRYLASNETAQYLFFPRRSSMINGREMVLLGLGSPGKNDYKLITVTF